MTAANNDVLAILSFPLFFWVCVEILKKGLSVLRLAALAGTVILCILSKNTAWLAAPISLVVILLAIFKGKKHEKFVWIALVLSGILGVLGLLSWRESVPAYFYSDNLSAQQTAREAVNWELGKTVIAQKSQEN
jgi:O-antigen ligase